MGLSKILFHQKQTTPTFYAASDEGDLVHIDWSIKPPVIQGVSPEDAAKSAEYIRKTYDSERSHRPVLCLERSPFYDELILTIHDFNFCIWNIELEG